MITPVTFAFLKAVKENNNVQRMHSNKDLYLMVRDNFREFGTKLIEETRKLDKSIGPLAIKDATFRFNKDIRFSKDKSPYKTNFGLIICDGGKHSDTVGYYVDIGPGQSFIGGGLYLPPRATADRVRNYMAKNYKQLEKIINAPAFKKTFGSLMGDKYVKVPKQFDVQHKAGERLKMKSRYIGHDLKDKEVLSKDFEKKCLEIFKIMKPLNDFLNEAIS
ncbi:MAG: DUF2461 domain-containing protein [candidate division SR1 bacterium]|nr:DUF2461 domain-containing protein [candidate division SR1 bacterium]